MSEILFTSDLHFRHKNILAYTDRFKLFCNDPDAVLRYKSDRKLYPNDGPTPEDIERMNEGIVTEWNRQVGPNDTVVHTGDFCFGGYENIKLWISRLNGKKRFVIGNHDDRKHWHRIGTDDAAKLGIERIYNDGASFKVGEQKMILSHFPYYIWDRIGHGVWNLCGHSHGNAADAPKKQLDVGIDNKYKLTGKFELWSFEEIKAIMDTKPIPKLDHHDAETNYQ